MPPRSSPTLTLPRGWTKTSRAGALHAISLAAAALTTAWGRAASRSPRRRQAAEVDRLRTELALVQEELEIKEARWARHSARRRPHYGPVERMRILQLRAARGWTTAQTARRFLVTEETTVSWMRRLDEGGESRLVRTGEPVNRFPEFVAYLVRRLKVLCPALGKRRIARVLARAGLHLGATTVGRMLTRTPSPDDVAAEEPVIRRRGVVAKRPNDVWHLDLTAVPTRAGFWVPWLPFTLPQCWPFCWWVAFALDQASRMVVGFAVFKTTPTSPEVTAFLDRAIPKQGARPRYVVTDKGSQFLCDHFRRWCRRRSVRGRFGAVGEESSILVIERFIRSAKSECTRQILVPLGIEQTRAELALYASWYNEHRPHEALGGRTPLEVHRRSPPANERPRFEPRKRWPRKARCAEPVVKIKGRRGIRFELAVRFVEGRRHLPIVRLKPAA